MYLLKFNNIYGIAKLMGQLVPGTTRTWDNSYPGQLVPRTTRTHVLVLHQFPDS